MALSGELKSNINLYPSMQLDRVCNQPNSFILCQVTDVQLKVDGMSPAYKLKNHIFWLEQKLKGADPAFIVSKNFRWHGKLQLVEKDPDMSAKVVTGNVITQPFCVSARARKIDFSVCK